MSVIHELPREQYPADAFAGMRSEAGFNLGTARALVWLSQLAYETRFPDKIGDILGSWGLAGGAIAAQPGTGGPGGSARGVAAIGGGRAVIALAGTDVLVPGDYLTDMAVRPDGDGLHRGFRAAATAMVPAIEQALSGHAGPVLVTGHSLGGAMAALAAHSLATGRGRSVTAVYTFGMPRLGGPSFGETYEAALGPVTYRLVHGSDPVATVPPLFAHVGRMLKAPRGGRFDAALLSQVPTPGEPPFVPTSPASLWERVSGLLPSVRSQTRRRDWVGQLLGHAPPSFADHFMHAYLEALDRSVRR